MEMTEKTFRVIRILSEDSLAINVGKNDNFNQDDQIEVFIEGENIYDELLDEELGKLYFIKDTLTITYASENYSICQKKVTETDFPLSNFQKMLGTQPAKTRTYIKNLNVFNDQIAGYGIPSENLTKTIVVGDLIRKKNPFD